MVEPYRPRHSGPRWSIVYGDYQGVTQFAVNEIQAALQELLPYVVEVRSAGDPALDLSSPIVLVGEPETNRYIAELTRQGQLHPGNTPESYHLRAMDSPWSGGVRLVAIAGAGPRGVLYGVGDFNARILGQHILNENPAHWRRDLDALPDYSFEESPAWENRGLWTWGYVIYDYRRFLDNMARLRMNLLMIWNDCPPVNIREVIEYARLRGVRIILGFHWGWGLEGIDLHRSTDRDTVRDMVVQTYRTQYADLDIDGIYFQTLTEHHQTEKDGVSTASVVCALVNDTARAIYALRPDLRIYFGLHATSIRDHYTEFSMLDPRVAICWEDAGSIPFSYRPHVPADAPADGWNATPEATLDYAAHIATFRPGAEFSFVPKGWINLRWPDEFEHHGPFILGERRSGWIRRRLDERSPEWIRRRADWFANAGHAARFYRGIRNATSATLTAAALVEDGMFEARIDPSVSLFAQMVWNPYRPDAEIQTEAMSPYWIRD